MNPNQKRLADADLAELKQHLDLVRGNHQLDVLGALTTLLQRVEEHGEKLHSMFSKWHELDATVRMNAKETDARLGAVAASTDGLDGLAQRVDAVVDRLDKAENALQQPHVDEVTRQAVKQLLATVDKLVNALQGVYQEFAPRFEALEEGLKWETADRRQAWGAVEIRVTRLEEGLKKLENALQVVDQGAGYRLRVEEGLKKLEALEKAVGGPVMERFLGLDGKGQPLTERMETAFQQAVEMDRLKKVEKDLEKLLAEAQAKNLALQAELKTLQAELAAPKGLRLPECVTCGVPAADHCSVPGTCKDDYPCCGNYRRSP